MGENSKCCCGIWLDRVKTKYRDLAVTFECGEHGRVTLDTCLLARTPLPPPLRQLSPRPAFRPRSTGHPTMGD